MKRVDAGYVMGIEGMEEGTERRSKKGRRSRWGNGSKMAMVGESVGKRIRGIMFEGVRRQSEAGKDIGGEGL